MTTRTSNPTTLHVRSAELRRAMKAVESRGDLPWDGRLAAAYGDRATLAVALHEHWSRQLLTRIDVALELGQHDPAESVARAWRSAVRSQPGVRRVLDQAAYPELVPLRLRLHRAVAVAAGLATFDDPVPVSAAAGEAFLDRLDARRPERSSSRLGRLLDRLWNGAATDDWPWAA